MAIRLIRLFSRLALFICGSAGNLVNPFRMLSLLGIVKLKVVPPLHSAGEIDSSRDRNLTAGIAATILAFLIETI
jgi:hypothetical protein